MNNEPLAWMHYCLKSGIGYLSYTKPQPLDNYKPIPLYTHPAKTLTDEELNKAFDYYCETDEGVLKFDFELRDEWKKEQLLRWKEALRKAQEKL